MTTFDHAAATKYVAKRMRACFKSQDTITVREDGVTTITRYASTANEVDAIVAEAYLDWHRCNVERNHERHTLASCKYAVGAFYKSIKKRKGHNGTTLRERSYSEAKSIVKELDSLPATQREILRLFGAKTGVCQIAEILGISNQYVSAVLRKAYSDWRAEDKPHTLTQAARERLTREQAARDELATLARDASVSRTALRLRLQAARELLAREQAARDAASREAFTGTAFTGRITVNELGQFSGLLPRAASREPRAASREPRAISKRLRKRIMRRIASR